MDFAFVTIVIIHCVFVQSIYSLERKRIMFMIA
jgi:hypothetical protein